MSSFIQETELKKEEIVRITNLCGPLPKVSLSGVLLVLFKPLRHVKGPAHKPALSLIYPLLLLGEFNVSQVIAT